MKTIIYRQLPSKLEQHRFTTFRAYDCRNSVFRYYTMHNSKICFVHHLGEHDKSKYNYFVPTTPNKTFDGIYFVNELDAVNFAANLYSYGLGQAQQDLPSYTKDDWIYSIVQ